MGKSSASNTVDDDLYEVEEICNHRSRRGAYEYEIKWKNYGTHENTWEPAKYLPEWMVKNYNQKHKIGNYFDTGKKLTNILEIDRNKFGQLIACVQFDNQDHFEYVPTEWINLNYPMMMIAFYEKRSYWRENQKLVKINYSKK